MSNGLGAGFGAALLLAVLLGQAALLAVALGATVVSDQRGGHITRPLQYLSVAVLAGVVATAGFGVLALADEAPVAAALFLAVALLPTVVTGGYLGRTTDLAPLGLLATTGAAWCLAYLLGIAAFVGTMAAAQALLGVGAARARQLHVDWAAVAVGALVTVAGAVAAGRGLYRRGIGQRPP